MSQSYVIRATLVNGQPFYCRAGRGWTSTGNEVEVLDQEHDPMLPNRVPTLPDVPDPKRVGRKSFAILKADPRISIHAVGGEEALAASVPELEARLSAAERGLEERARELADSKHDAADAVGKLERAQKALLAKTDELAVAQKERDGLLEKLLAAEKEVADLKATLEDLTKPAATAPAEGESKAGSKRL